MTKRDETRSTRRDVLRAGVAVIGGVAAVRASQAQAQTKIEPAMVQYQTMPKDGHKCGDCVNFEAPSGCKIVAGTISPDGWCAAFAPKA